MIKRLAVQEIDTRAFLKDVKKCTGRLYLETPQGDKFDLRSIFSRYILAAVIKDGKFPEGAYYSFDEENLSILEPYLV